MFKGVAYVYKTAASVTKLKSGMVMFTLSTLPSYELPTKMLEVRVEDGKLIVVGECNETFLLSRREQEEVCKGVGVVVSSPPNLC